MHEPFRHQQAGGEEVSFIFSRVGRIAGQQRIYASPREDIRVDVIMQLEVAEFVRECEGLSVVRMGLGEEDGFGAPVEDV